MAGLRDGQDSHEDGIGPGIGSDVMGSSGGLPSNVIATTPSHYTQHLFLPQVPHATNDARTTLSGGRRGEEG